MKMRACDYYVYHITYTDRVMHRIPTCGGMDSEFSHWENDIPREYFCVAPTDELAMAAFNRLHSNEHVKNVLIAKRQQLNDLVYLQ